MENNDEQVNKRLSRRQFIKGVAAATGAIALGVTSCSEGEIPYETPQFIEGSFLINVNIRTAPTNLDQVGHISGHNIINYPKYEVTFVNPEVVMGTPTHGTDPNSNRWLKVYDSIKGRYVYANIRAMQNFNLNSSRQKECTLEGGKCKTTDGKDIPFRQLVLQPKEK